MSQKKTKAPTMVLQEFTQKHKYSLPKYELVDSMANHGNKFSYKVDVAIVCATGFGHSKREARQNAAFNALKQLADVGLQDSDTVPKTDITSKPRVNFIGNLNELCDKYKLPHPVFNDESVVEQHCQEFTYECKLSSLTTIGLSSNKKQAKQLAARLMLDRIRDTYPVVSKQHPANSNGLTNKDRKASAQYNKLASISDSKSKSEITDISDMFVKLMAARHVSYEDFKEQFQKRDKAGLNSMCAMLDVTYTISMLQENPPIACAHFGEGIFTIMAVGTTKESAELNLINEIYIILDVYMGMSDSSLSF